MSFIRNAVLNVIAGKPPADLPHVEAALAKVKPDDIVVTKRIGIKKSVDLPWRFYIKDNPYISRK